MHKNADQPQPVWLLRTRRERPRHCRAAEQRNEVAPSHYSMTSSASKSRLSEILMPSVLAVLRLSTSSNLLGRTTGKSAGLAPLRMRPAKTRMCTYVSAWLLSLCEERAAQ